MAYVTLYRDINYAGPFIRMGPGFFSGKKLVGQTYIGGIPSSTGDELDNKTSSIRVPANFIVSLHDSYSISAGSPNGARVIVGPQDVTDLTAIGMKDRVSSVLVAPYKAFNSAYAIGNGVVLRSDYGMAGMKYVLDLGDYDSVRLASEFGSSSVSSSKSATVDPHVVAVFYEGNSFESNMNAVVAVGPTSIQDTQKLGLQGGGNTMFGSVRVVAKDPRDSPYDEPLPTRPVADVKPIAREVGQDVKDINPVLDPSQFPRARQKPTVEPTVAPTVTQAVTPTVTQAVAPAPKGADRQFMMILAVLVMISIILSAMTLRGSRGGPQLNTNTQNI